jgi:hypothetical protein
MAGKKISELNEVTNPTDADEFVFVDKEGTGSDSGIGGKSAKITFANLKSAIGATNGQKGEPGEKGDKGDLGPQGSPGEGADSYWITGSVADTIGYTGKVGVGTIDPSAKLDVVGSGIASGSDLSKERVLSIGRPSVGGVTYGQKVNLFLSKYEGTETSGITTQARTRLDIALAHSNGENGEVSDVDGTNERDGGTRVMTITSDGKVAIGKTDKVNFPEATLDVYGRVHLGPLTTGTVNHRIRVGGGKTGDVDNGLSFVPGNAQTTDQFISFKTGSSVLVGAFGSVSDELLIRTRENATALKIAQNGNLDANGTIKSTGLNVQGTGSTINLHTTRSSNYSYVSIKNTTSSKDPILLGYHTAGDFNIARADGSYAKLRLWHDDSRMHIMSSTTFHDNGSVCIGGSPEKVRNAKFSVTQGDGLFAMIPEGYHGWPELKSLNEAETDNKPLSIGQNSRSPYIHNTGGPVHAHIGIGTVKPEHPLHMKHGNIWSGGLVTASSMIAGATTLTTTTELDPSASNYANGSKIMVNGIEMILASVSGTTINLEPSTPYTGGVSDIDLNLIFMKDSLNVTESGLVGMHKVDVRSDDAEIGIFKKGLIEEGATTGLYMAVSGDGGNNNSSVHFKVHQPSSSSSNSQLHITARTSLGDWNPMIIANADTNAVAIGGDDLTQNLTDEKLIVHGHARTHRIFPAIDNYFDVGHLNYRWDDIVATNGTIATSDANEKNTIVDSDLGLNFIKKLSPKSYKFNSGSRTHYGLIAQDVENVLSDVSKDTSEFAGFIKQDVSENNDESDVRYGLRYNEFIAPMMKAIQEQQAMIESLKAEVDALKNK